MNQPTDEQLQILRKDHGMSERTLEDLRLTREEAEYLINPKGRRRR